MTRLLVVALCWAGLQTGTSALKQAKAESGLSVRTVDDAMLEAEELISEQASGGKWQMEGQRGFGLTRVLLPFACSRLGWLQREVGESLAQPLDSSAAGVSDEAELLQELEALALQDKQEKAGPGGAAVAVAPQGEWGEGHGGRRSGSERWRTRLLAEVASSRREGGLSCSVDEE